MSIALLMAMSSCSSSDDEVVEIKEESKLVPMTFTATQESNAGTRSALNGNSVKWQTNDKISVFDGTGAEGNHEFTLTGNVDDRKFSGTASSTATKFTAVYPYTSGAALNADGSVSGITLPATQTAKAGSFDPNAALMMAVSTTDKKYNLDFKNAVSLVKITTEFACKKIVLSANVNIAGTGTLNYNTDAPSISFTSNQSQTITLKPETEGGVIDAGTYYIAICPHNSTGFSISFINSNDTEAYTQTSTKENTFNRSKIKNLGTFTESGTWTSTIESNGTVKASQQVDLGLTIKGADNKTYKLIFAKSNLTENGLAASETDYGDYFAWGATEPWYTSINKTNNTWSAIWKPGKEGGYKQTNCPSYDNAGYVNNGVLEMGYDAARHILGGGWQIPTRAIWEALVNNSTTKGFNSGRKGYEFKNNNQTLFLPAGGKVNDTSFTGVGSIVLYWSGTPNSSTFAKNLYFYIGGVITAANDSYRYEGFSVRPVRLVEVSQSQQ